MDRVILPFPPSVNNYWRAPNKGKLKGKHLISERGRKYKTEVLASLVEQIGGLPKTIWQDVEAEIVLFPGDRRRRDADNYCKALFDSLVKAGLLEDDSQIKRFTIEWGEVVPGGKVMIKLAPYTRDPVTFPGDKRICSKS